MNKQDEDGKTALMKAAREGHHKCVDSLLQAEADVAMQDTKSHTALMFARDHYKS